MRKIVVLFLITFLLTACRVVSTSGGLHQEEFVEDHGGTSDLADATSTVEGKSSEQPMPGPSTPTPHPEVEQASSDIQDPLSPRMNVRVDDQKEYRFSQLLPFDGIRPIYNPEFVLLKDAQDLLQEDELVIGVAWRGEAKAYPITVLIFREMVNDELAGIPTLVTCDRFVTPVSCTTGGLTRSHLRLVTQVHFL